VGPDIVEARHAPAVGVAVEQVGPHCLESNRRSSPFHVAIDIILPEIIFRCLSNIVIDFAIITKTIQLKL
jgi:hypothetical protein